MIEDGPPPAAPPSVAGAHAAPYYGRNDSIDNNWFASEDRRSSVVNGGAGHADRAPYSKMLDPGQRRLYETTDDYVEKFTILLNFCIEDIEGFCAEVREIKQGERPGVKLQDIQATNFTQMFQKFKLSFNLLVLVSYFNSYYASQFKLG